MKPVDQIDTIVLTLGQSERYDPDAEEMPSSKDLAAGAFASARAFREIVNRIKNQELTDINPISDQLTSIVALSCEIYLKCLLYYEKPADAHNFVEVHELDYLYNQLGSSKDLIVEQMSEKYDRGTIEEELRNRKIDFIELRYDYELKHISNHFGFLYDLMESLHIVCNDLLSDESDFG